MCEELKEMIKRLESEIGEIRKDKQKELDSKDVEISALTETVANLNKKLGPFGPNDGFLDSKNKIKELMERQSKLEASKKRIAEDLEKTNRDISAAILHTRLQAEKVIGTMLCNLKNDDTPVNTIDGDEISWCSNDIPMPKQMPPESPSVRSLIASCSVVKTASNPCLKGPIRPSNFIDFSQPNDSTNTSLVPTNTKSGSSISSTSKTAIQSWVNKNVHRLHVEVDFDQYKGNKSSGDVEDVQKLQSPANISSPRSPRNPKNRTLTDGNELGIKLEPGQKFFRFVKEIKSRTQSSIGRKCGSIPNPHRITSHCLIAWCWRMIGAEKRAEFKNNILSTPFLRHVFKIYRAEFIDEIAYPDIENFLKYYTCGAAKKYRNYLPKLVGDLDLYYKKNAH